MDLLEQFSDLKPVPQDDGPDPVCPIMYTPEFTATMDVFRAVLQADERSERTLALTERVIDLNSANYTAWQFRRLVIDAIGADLDKELEFCASIAKESAKNYQLWHHRREVVSRLNDPSKELSHTELILSEDSKNYHAWSHRLWVLDNFHLWANELEFVEYMLEEDPRNNSAWNQRWHACNACGGWTDQVIDRELDFTFEHIEDEPDNESPWNYLIGIASDQMNNRESRAITMDSIVDRIDRLFNLHPKEPMCASGLAEVLVCINTAESHARARLLFTSLTTLDPIRSKYWNMRAQQSSLACSKLKIIE